MAERILYHFEVRITGQTYGSNREEVYEGVMKRISIGLGLRAHIEDVVIDTRPVNDFDSLKRLQP